MGSVSDAAGWTAEDDVLLKTAVEAGASLESLAKGAVCFSHKFALQELQDRWYSLVYNLETSAQASARMAKYKAELLASNPAKANKLFNSKAKGFSVYKRKIDSVKTQYYAWRKRICHEPCLSTDFGYVGVPCSCIRKDGVACACGCQFKCSEDHQLVHTVYRPGGAVSSYGCVCGSDDDKQHAQQCSFDMENVNSDGSIVIDGNSNHGILKGYSDVHQLYGYDYMQNNPQISEKNIVSAHNWSNLSNQYDTGSTGSKVLPIIDQDGINHDQFSWNNTGGLLEQGSFNAGRDRWCSQDPGIPTWSKLLGVRSPELIDVHRIEQDTLMLFDGKMEMNNNGALEFQAHLNGGMSAFGLGNAMVPEGGLMRSNLKSFGEKEDIEFLSSEHVSDSHTKAFLKGGSRGPHVSHVDPVKMKQNMIDVPRVDTIPASEEVLYHGYNVKCILNTEDFDIPFNVHIPVPDQSSVKPTSNLDQDSQYDMCLVPTKALNIQNIVPSPLPPPPPPLPPIKGVPAIEEQKEIVMSLGEGCVVGNVSPGMHYVIGGDNSDMLAKVLHSVDEGEEKGFGSFQHECCDDLHTSALNNSIQASDEMNCRLLADKARIGCENAIQSHTISHALSDIGFHNPIPSMSVSGQAEGSDSENSVPDFLDLEALILNQDLIPWDEEYKSIQPEVSRFHSPESRKDLIRLEKGACSYMNRSIISKGAFAIIYGQNLRYYIRDTEITLGRETEEVHVDIDLGKEGKANKISRRQAVIKMDDDGSFYMKNIGKGSVFVNGKEVPCNKSIILTSDSLIEIKNMKFIFHVNHNAVRQHIIRARRGSFQGKNTVFDWDQKP